MLTLVQDEETHKENLAPINNFHKALLKAKDASLHNHTPPVPFQSSPNNIQRAVSPDPKVRNMPPASLANPVPPSNERPTNEKAAELLAPSHIDQNELSAIAEDDENLEQSYRSHISVQAPHHGQDPQPRVSVEENVSTSGRTNIPSTLPETGFQEVPQAMNLTTSSSDTFHSISLDSPQVGPASKVPARSPSPLPASPLLGSGPPESQESRREQLGENNTKTPLASWNSADMTAPPPSITPAMASSSLPQDFDAPLHDDPLAPSSPRDVGRQPAISLYPTLPAPMPLRKSMRAPRDPSVGAGPLGATTPGAPLGGKRTSWLKKAREVKALEGTGRNIATLGLPVAISQPLVPFLTNPLKRKSGDMVVAPTTTGLEDEERHHKSAKNADGDVAPLQPPNPQTAKGKEKDEQPPPSVQSSYVPILHNEHEGMLDRLKKTVEGLGARVGKSMGKSLGAGPAGNALAEARAAAEARVAERNNKDEEFTRVLATATPETIIPQPSKTPPALMDERNIPNLPVSVSSSTKEAERRLSISDLFPPNDGVTKIKSKASEKIFQITPPDNQSTFDGQRDTRRESGTTTPPDSPPTIRPTSFVLPSGPVFNKPPPVFIPPAPAIKPVLSAPQSFPAPPTMVRPAPLTAQSTMESLKSDKPFDHDDDVPAWMPATQDTEYFGSQDDGGDTNVLDEDDSWPLDEKLASGTPWTFGSGMSKEDSITWSTAPSQSQRLDTVHSQKDKTSSTRLESELQTNQAIPGAFDMEMDNDEREVSVIIADDDADLEEIVMGGASTVALVEVSVFLPSWPDRY